MFCFVKLKKGIRTPFMGDVSCFFFFFNLNYYSIFLEPLTQKANVCLLD